MTLPCTLEPSTTHRLHLCVDSVGRQLPFLFWCWAIKKKQVYRVCRTWVSLGLEEHSLLPFFDADILRKAVPVRRTGRFLACLPAGRTVGGKRQDAEMDSPAGWWWWWWCLAFGASTPRICSVASLSVCVCACVSFLFIATHRQDPRCQPSVSASCLRVYPPSSGLLSPLRTRTSPPGVFIHFYLFI